MRVFKFTLLLVLFLSFQEISAQSTLYVSLSGSNSSPYSSLATAATDIQTAVDAASAGDLILVDDGTYVLTTNISVTKGVTIRSINGNSYVTVDGNNATRCFYINHVDAVVDGLSITNGYNPGGFGGGVNIAGGGTVQNCIITNSQARDGGGVAIDSDGLVLNCVISSNSADNNSGSGYGGGVRMLNGGITRGSLIHSNTSVNYGGGINIWNAGTIQSCTITNNTAPNGAGARTRNLSVMENTISYFNNGLDIQLNGAGYVFNNNCTTNSHLLPGSGNISDDPFSGVDYTVHPFDLTPTSNCIDAGLNQAWMTGAFDLDANNRIIGGTVDIGAYEFTGQTIISDDFNPETTLDTNIWEFFDPVGDATLTLSGTNAKIAIPQGTGSHDLGSNLAPRLLQSIDDIDFEVEVKFESIPNTQYQMQGIVVQTSTNAWLRFETYAAPAPTFYVNSYGVSFPIPTVNIPVGGAIPQYLRVLRSGDDWTFNFSYDGLTWSTVTTFTLAVPVNKVGFYGANHTPNPGFTVNADYFMNLASPITDTDVQAPIPPVVDVWYGNTQNFGQQGNPQTWVNILGRATDDISVSSLTYTLNGGSSIPLTIGPNGTRLVGSGDFNIEIERAALINGANTVAITATDGDAASTTETVTLNYTSGNVWPLPYTADWGSIADIEDIDQVAEVADGLWELTPGGIKTVQTGYDRLLVVGDQTWTTNYEVEVPITIHSNQSDAGIGFAVGWQGHTGSVSPRTQWPLQAIGWVRYAGGSPNLRILTYTTGIEASQPISITNGTTYILKARSEAIGGGQSRFYVKIWEDGTAEPGSWMIQSDIASRDGSVLLITHKSDVTWGNMTITPVAGNSPPIITSTPVNTAELGEVYTYNAVASDPDVGDVLSFRLSSSPGWLTLVDNGDGTALLTGTPTNSGSVGENDVILIVEDQDLASHSQSFPIYVVPAGQTYPISDDFYPETMFPHWWRPVDPRGDCTFGLTGTNLEINVGAGISHDSWSSGVYAARLLEFAWDTDLRLEAKFDSQPTEKYQMQGIVVQEDDDTIFRFEVFHDGVSPRIFAAFVDAGTNTAVTYYNAPPVPSATPSYLRVERAGDNWTYSYSFNGINWTTAITFSHPMSVREVGVYGGNHTPSPAFTVDVDYFMNLDHPIFDDISGVPAIPVLASPADEAVDLSIETLLTWGAAFEAETYSVEVAADELFSNIIYSNSGLTTTSVSLTGLSNNTEYFWRVSAENAAGTSGFSGYNVFTTITGNTPVISWPTGGTLIYGDSQMLYWYPSLYVAGILYDVLYSTNSDMSNPVIVQDLAGTFYNLTGLSGGTTYYWQVRLKTSTGIIVSYSTIESFETIPFAAGPTTPIPSWPVGGEIVYTNSPTLFWYLGTLETGLTYEVEYTTGTLIGSPNILDIETTNVTLTGLNSGTTFYWHVRSFDGVDYSDWSEPQSFETIASPEPIVPVPSWPIGGTTVYTVTPTLYWYLNGPADGLTYEVEYSTGSLIGSPNILNINSTNVELPELDGGTLYNWQVRSTDGVANSDWSVQESFTTHAVSTGPVVPTPSWPVGGAQVYSDSQILYWYLGADGTGLTYEVEYSSGALSGVPSITDIPNLNTALSGLAPGTIYSWQVRSTDGFTNSDWSVQESFETVGGTGGPTVPYPSWPIGGATVYSNSPTLSWYLGTSATGISYDVQYSTDPGMIGAIPVTGINALSTTLSGLTSGVTYHWQVRAFDGVVYSAYSIPQSFTTSANNLSVVPLPGSPSGGVTIETNSATLSWILPTAASELTYELQYSTNPEMSGAANLFAESASEEIDNLQDGKTYYWRIRSKTTNGEISSFSNIEKFKVSSITSTEEVDEEIPTEYSLKQNFPNPFNPATTISFSLPQAGYYTLTVYNIIGQKITTLLAESMDAGSYDVVFDASKLASGLYLYRLSGENVNLTRKMVLMK